MWWASGTSQIRPNAAVPLGFQGIGIQSAGGRSLRGTPEAFDVPIGNDREMPSEMPLALIVDDRVEVRPKSLSLICDLA